MEVLPLSIFIVTILVNITLGTFVYTRNPKKPDHINLALFTIALVGWVSTVLLYYLFDQHDVVVFIGRVNFAFSIFIPLFFFRFVYFFPNISVSIKFRYHLFAILITVFWALIALFSPYVAEDEIVKGVERETKYGFLYLAYISSFLIILLSGITLAIVKLRKATAITKLQLQYLLTGFSLVFFTALITNVLLPYYHIYSAQPFSPLTTVLFLITITYSILKHKLFDINRLTARIASYTLLVLSVGLIYIFGTIEINSFVLKTEYSQSQLISSGILTTLLILSFNPLLKLFTMLTDSIFFKKAYSPQDFLQQIAKTASSTIELDLLTQQLTASIKSQMRLSKVLIVAMYGKQPYWSKSTESNDLPPFINPTEFEVLSQIQDIAVLDNYEQLNNTLSILLTRLEMVICIPLKTTDTTTGFLFLGRKQNGEIFFDEDIKVLQIMAPEIAISLHNAQQFQQIKNFNLVLKQRIEEATVDLRNANEHLKQLDKLKDEFVSLASHELRTPLATIKGFIYMSITRDQSLSEYSHEKLNRALHSTEHLIAIVNDMLDVSRIEGGRIDLKPTDFDISTLINDVVEDLSSLIQTKQMHIQAEPISNTVYADKEKIQQVIMNLLSNAVKYTPAGGSIRINFKLQNDQLVTYISDNGIGVRKEDLTKLFTKFGRITQPDQSIPKIPGTGLGLYISKKIIELSHGQVSVESEFGKGSTFSFSLPIKNPLPEQIPTLDSTSTNQYS